MQSYGTAMTHSSKLKYLAAFIALLLLTGGGWFYTRKNSGDLDVVFLAKKAEIFKQFNIKTAKPGEFPITILPKDKAPPIMDKGDIAWLDNDTIIYVPDKGLSPEEMRNNPGSLSLISLNLTTFEKKEIARVSTQGFCYDYETHNIRYVGVAGEDEDRKIATIYGKLGGELKTFVVPPRSKHRKGNGYTGQKYAFTNPSDCTFFPVIPETRVPGLSSIRKADGYIESERKDGKDVPGSYILTKPDGTVKHFKLGYTIFPAFFYDHFSKQYWHYEDTHWQKGAPDGIKVWRLDRDFNVASEEFYRHGPWPYGYPLHASVRPGFLIGSAMWAGPKLTADTKIHDLTYLITKEGIITEVAEDLLSPPFAISPDGCRAVATRLLPPEQGNPKNTGELAVLNVCGSNEGDKK